LLLGIRELGALMFGALRICVHEALCEPKNCPVGDSDVVGNLPKALISTEERQRLLALLLGDVAT